MSTDFGKRLKAARRFAGLTQRKLAALVGMAQTSLSEAETRGHGSTFTYQLAIACGINPNWLATGDGEMILDTAPAVVREQPGNYAENNYRLALTDAHIRRAEYSSIRHVRFKLSASATGFQTIDADDDDLPPLMFPHRWLLERGLKPEKLVAFRICNGSMEPTLFHNDTLVVNTEDTEPRDGEVFAVNYEGELVVKRLVRDAGQWWLSSDNPDKRRYPNKRCSEGVFLLGHAIHKQSDRV